MSFSLGPLLNQFVVFVLVLTRVSGLVMTAPMLGSRAVPLRVRTFIAAALALLVTPLHWSKPVAGADNLVELLILMGREAVLGVALGLGILILFAGLQLAGQIIGQMSGMQLASVIDPGTETSVPIFSQLLDLTMLVVFLAIGGHRQLVSALLDTFQKMPPGQVRISENLLGTLNEVTSQSFQLGVRAAAPIVVALLLSLLILGLISRTLPQLNVIAVGFSFHSMIMLATLSLSLGAAAWIFQDQAVSVIDEIHDAILQGQ